MSLILIAATPPLRTCLIQFLVLVIVLAIIGGLIYCIEKWVHPLPPPVKLVLAIVFAILVLIWALNMFGGL